MNFLVLAAQPWAETLYDETLFHLPGVWSKARTQVDLDRWLSLNWPYGDTIFSLHWHWKLLPEVVERHRCIGFHASDLPHFRGGDPIGNQISRGVFDTQLTAFRLDAGLDTGPILLKRPLSLRGSREEIFERISGHVARMIPHLAYTPIDERPQPAGGSFYSRKDVLCS